MPVIKQDIRHSRCIKIRSGNTWQPSLDIETQSKALADLESGQVICFPELTLNLSQEEQALLTADLIDPKVKNISYQMTKQQLRGVQGSEVVQAKVKSLMHRYAKSAEALIASYFPRYMSQIEIGRTSLRPVEIKGRIPASYRKDDTRLHVDAFPSSPNQGKRILRVFCNINPHGVPRVWRLGEPFESLAQKFVPKIPKPCFGSQWFLKTFKITKGPRTPYDHYMLQLHDRMKYDMRYQGEVAAEEVDLPANSTWIVFTDQVSHAALSGQHMLEQTFYLPVEAMADPAQSPLKILEKLKGCSLIE
jgi:hypothetical protein